MGFLFWMSVVFSFWGLLVFAAVKGWTGMAVGLVVCVVVLHLFPGFMVLNTAFVSVMHLR